VTPTMRLIEPSLLSTLLASFLSNSGLVPEDQPGRAYSISLIHCRLIRILISQFSQIHSRLGTQLSLPHVLSFLFPRAELPLKIVGPTPYI